MQLYVSDLDGTLLNSKQQLSKYTVDIINSLIDNGLNFTIATARSYESAESIISPLNLKLPIVLHNGVFVYDPIKKENVVSNLIDNIISNEIIEYLVKKGINPIIYTSQKECNRVYYKGIFNNGQEVYIGDRLQKRDKRFTKVKNFDICSDKSIITVVSIGEEEILKDAYNFLKENYDLGYHFTKDIYSGYYWLEIAHKKASKKEGIEFLRKYLNAQKVTCFGDNLNDYSMFEVCEEKYAVKNAHKLLKKIATKVIDSNENNGVAEFLKGVL